MADAEAAPKAATASTKKSVTMADGSTVEFNQKQKLVKTSTVDDNGNFVSLRLDFVNGQTRTFTPRADLLGRFAAHGAEQKLGDAIAGENDIDDAVLAVDDLIKRLDAGEWTITRQGGGFAGTSILIQALVEVSGKSVDDVKAFLANKTQAEKLALRRSDKLAPVVQRLEAEKQKNSKTTVDTGALLGELGLGDEAPAKKSKNS